MKTKYVQRVDEEGFEVPLNETYRLACCDCGLVHDVAFAYEDGVLAMAAKRNNTETKRRRKEHGKNIRQGKIDNTENYDNPDYWRAEAFRYKKRAKQYRKKIAELTKEA